MVTTEASSLAVARPAASPRNGGIDALRAALVGLVVLHHTALTYGGTGAWFYREIEPSSAPSSLLLALFCTVNQAYFMGLLFLIAGYFTPGAVDRHGVAGFIRERLIRLGLPLLVFGFLLGPVTVAMAVAATGRNFFTVLWLVWNRVPFIPGPLWFVEALLVFSALYVLWLRVGRTPSATAAFPSNRTLLLAAIATGAAAFLLRLVWPVGATFLALQLGYFASYAVLFAAGCIGARAEWLERIPADQAALWRRIALAVLAVFPVVVVVAARVPVLGGPPTGGLNVPAAVYAFWEPFVAWGIIMTLLVVFQRRFAQLDAFWAAASRRAYLVYIIHPPVLVAVSLLLRGLAAPPLVKFAVTGSIAVALCFLLAGLLLRVPGLRRVV